LAASIQQRAYRAPCPGCGAPVEFRSAQSTHAVCGYCQSTVVREGEKLTRLGRMAELFDDHSPLRLLASGRFGKNAFTLVGRLQYKYGEGSWSEWHALLDDGSTAWLSEDNGAYVFMRPATLSREVPAEENFRPGLKTSISGQTFSVASNESVALIAAQGELPHLPELGTPFAMVELRNDSGEVLSIDYGPTLKGAAPDLARGRSVTLDELQLAGLADESVKDEKGRQFNCPNCGAPVTVALASSKSITCGSCNSIIDLSQGTGAQLVHAIQDEPLSPLIPLGSVGQFQGASWQVVGFQHRMGHEPGDDEQFGWSEYLLYNQKRGFTFLVDSSEGWSLVKPVPGAPSLSADRQSATYLGTTYRLKETYDAQTTYVAGEFYWQVRRGQATSNRDYAAGKSLLLMEESAREITWSAGSQIDSDSVAKAFKQGDKQALFKRSDVGPFSAAPGLSVGTILWIFFGGLLLFILLSRCTSSCDPRYENCSSSGSSYRSSGGSWGGSSSGGGHK
jgi:ribosomal protein S27E